MQKFQNTSERLQRKMFKEKIIKRVPIGAWEVKLESMIDRSKTDQPTDRPTDQPTNRKGISKLLS